METTEVSDVQTSVDPAPSLLEPGERSPFDKSTAASLVGLVYLARQTAEEKRRKQCLEAVNAILKIEPEHAEALAIRATVRAELARDFETARATARRARLENDPRLCGQVVAMLRRIVDAEPENLEAQNLLYECLEAEYFCAAAPAARSDRRWKRRSLLAGSVVAAVVLAAAALTSGRNRTQASPPLQNAAASLEKESPVRPASFTPFNAPTPPPAVVETTAALRPASPAPTPPPPTNRVENAPAAPLIPPPPTAPSAPATPSMGGLAINAAVPVEVYRGDEHLGSTPLTLQLPTGPQTLEYRYQGLRQTLTHLIAADATATASISFLTRVQINAKPWAQVFIDGIRKTPIGQTPLGDVQVPLGSVLVFQNPGFADKRHRVTARDTAIQVTFP